MTSCGNVSNHAQPTPESTAVPNDTGSPDGSANNGAVQTPFPAKQRKFSVFSRKEKKAPQNLLNTLNNVSPEMQLSGSFQYEEDEEKSQHDTGDGGTPNGSPNRRSSAPQ